MLFRSTHQRHQLAVVNIKGDIAQQRMPGFLGFGLAPHDPSLGLLLADALRYLSSGAWWLAFFPGFILVSLVLVFDQFARALQQLWIRIT